MLGGRGPPPPAREGFPFPQAPIPSPARFYRGRIGTRGKSAPARSIRHPAGKTPPTHSSSLRATLLTTHEKTFLQRSHHATRKPKKIPSAQRAGARRRSPLRGSAAVGAHIAREAGRCAPTAPCGERRTGDTTYDRDSLRHTDKGEYGGRRGCRGARPSHPLPPAAQATKPGCRAAAAGQRKKEKRANLAESTQALGQATVKGKKAAGRTIRHCMRLPSGTVHVIIKGKPFPQPPGIATLPIRPNAPHPAYRRKRGMARRRSPPRRGGSSDAARTLVSRHARDSGRAMPNAARQEGGRGTTLADLQIVTVGCPNAGLGVVGGKGLRKPLIPCPISAVDARKAPSSPNGHGPFGPPFGRPPGGDHAGMPAAAAGQQKKEKEKGAMFQRKNRCPRQGQAEATKQGKEKVFRSERARKKSRKGRTKFLSLGKAKCKRADSPGTARGRN